MTARELLPLMNSRSEAQNHGAAMLALIAIFAAYACARGLEVFSSAIPRMRIVALDVLSAATVVVDATGRPWHTAHILVASALVSIAGMGTFVILAWLRAATRTRRAL